MRALTWRTSFSWQATAMANEGGQFGGALGEGERRGGLPTEVAALLDLSDFLVIVSQVWRTGGDGVLLWISSRWSGST